MHQENKPDTFYNCLRNAEAIKVLEKRVEELEVTHRDDFKRDYLSPDFEDKEPGIVKPIPPEYQEWPMINWKGLKRLLIKAAALSTPLFLIAYIWAGAALKIFLIDQPQPIKGAAYATLSVIVAAHVAAVVMLSWGRLLDSWLPAWPEDIR